MTGRPRVRFAQHFLESAWIDRVIAKVSPDRKDLFLEIGPGKGALTRNLATRTARVVAVEIDHNLASLLRQRMPDNVTVVTTDFLTLDLDSVPELASGDLRVAGNLPYNVGSAIVLKLLTISRSKQRLRDATLMLQREVADRVTATPGTNNWGPLAVRTTLHAEASSVLSLPPGAFRPMPTVRSALVKLRFRPSPVTVRYPDLLDRLVRTIFTQRRKQVVNALRPALSTFTSMTSEQALERAGIDPTCRPSELGLVELAELSEVLAASQR